MDLRGNQPKHLLCSLLQWASRDTMPLNSLARTLQVTRPKYLLSQVMECPQPLKLVMGLNHQLNLHMDLDMEHLKRKNLLLNHPPLLGDMVNHQLCMQVIPILSLHHLVMLSLILVRVHHHPAMVLQRLRQVMGLHLMAHRHLVSQVMGRCHPTIHLMVLLGTHSPHLRILLKE